MSGVGNLNSIEPMNKFRIHSGSVATLNRANVDTDQIIPKQFLKRVERTGFGQFLFYDWRYLSDGKLNPEFILNEPRYRGASILLTGKNFGCGSSREHAPWALAEYGFRVIIAPSFADIFANNCLKNGLLPIVLPEADVSELIGLADHNESYVLTVDLECKEIKDSQKFKRTFSIGEFQRYCLLEGLDDIALTLQHDSDIAAFEASRPDWIPSLECGGPALL
jgi:3-isopropylmalate/(R)-2-methylmalate dehydratase small subunit